MNILGHLSGNTSQEHQFECLARHIAHWNNHFREAWLINKWAKNQGQESCDALRVRAAQARIELVVARDKQAKIDKDTGRAALEALRGKAA